MTTFDPPPPSVAGNMFTVWADTIRTQQARIAEQDETIRTQQARIAHLEEHARRLGDQHRSDVAAIGDALLAEAENRGWCDEFDTFVTELNRRLHVYLPTREKDYQVTYEVTIRVGLVLTCIPDEIEREAQTYRDVLWSRWSHEDTYDIDVTGVTVHDHEEA